ncbi:hypothetical protein SOVF_138400, partial [Spinacia oleracea]
TTESNGVFTGINAYHFDFIVKYEPITALADDQQPDAELATESN